MRINMVSLARRAEDRPNGAMGSEAVGCTQVRPTLSMQATRVAVFGKGVAALGIGGLELARIVATGSNQLGPRPHRLLELIWPVLTLLICGVCDLAAFETLRHAYRLVWTSSAMSALALLVVAVIGAAAGVPRHSGVLGAAIAPALVCLIISRRDYCRRTSRQRASSARGSAELALAPDDGALARWSRRRR